ncbi:MAG: YpdA family putative bacillithiol disulfide reductase [Candidatus Kapabacteria bacterium]|nr:YpdA family putative bacillithiol disulfide reductase [Candidatus Kapabacteria bacterium]MDW8012423.1 YpdA family putative bacillithiol disulfide reductase [Bacteroidota bacterium]
MEELWDTVIIGAGPTGLSCGIEAQRAGLRFLILEKGALVDSIRRFPTNMVFFSTAENLELGGIPFPTAHPRPTRVEALQYYRRVAEYFRLPIRLYTPVVSVERDGGLFSVRTAHGETLRSRIVIVATGYFDQPNLLEVPGEELPHVTHYYTEPYGYVHTRVAVIGGRNSAVETALDLYRHGATVFLIHRRAWIGESVKYWLKPDIENRIRRGEIRAYFQTVVEAIEPKRLWLRNLDTEQRFALEVDFVIAHTGYRPNASFLESMGIELQHPSLVPVYNPETFETSVPGLYVAGSVVCGCETWNVFIENGRAHAVPIIADILQRHVPNR